MNIKDHAKFLETAEWDDIAENLMELEQQRFYLKDELTKKELKLLNDLIGLYEQHRANELYYSSLEGGFERTMNREVRVMENDISDLEDGY
jgi:hypothetical protein